MSNTFDKTKKYRKQADGTELLQSTWTSAESVELSDGRRLNNAIETIETSISDEITKLVDGTTVVGKATGDSDGNIITDTYVTYNTADNFVGKNLLPNTAPSKTRDGIEFTVNDDGSVTVNGTATSTALFYTDACKLNKNETYIASGTPNDSDTTKYSIVLHNTVWMLDPCDTGEGVEFVASDIYGDEYGFGLVIKIEKGVTVENVTFYPMIRKASIADDTYEPYFMNNKEITDMVYNGTVNSANLLNVETTGDINTPVYFENGVPVPTNSIPLNIEEKQSTIANISENVDIVYPEILSTTKSPDIPTEFALETSIAPRNVCFGGGKYVWCTSKGNMYSYDGEKWYLSNSAGHNSIAYGNGMFICSGGSVSQYSYDGIIWNDMGNYYPNIGSITFGNGIFAGINTLGVIYYTTDGLSWNIEETELGSSKVIKFCNGYFFALGGSTGEIFMSKDAITWTTLSLYNLDIDNYVIESNAIWVDIIHDGDKYLLTTRGFSNVIFSTVDFVSWSSISTGEESSGVYYIMFDKTSNLYVLTSNTNKKIYYSSDLITWTSVEVTDVIGGNPAGTTVYQYRPRILNKGKLILGYTRSSAVADSNILYYLDLKKETVSKTELLNHLEKDKVGKEDIENIVNGTTVVGKASNADTATKATQDSNGNVISDTYATKESISNINNTSDANKPVSTAQRTAIDEVYKNSNTYTDEKIADLINGAPTTLDTLKEIADAMAEHEDVVEALNGAIGTKSDKSEVDALLKNNASKNLLEVTTVSQTINGVTFTVNEDGSVTANGTASDTAIFYINESVFLDTGTYILSGCPSGGGSSTYAIELRANIGIFIRRDTGRGDTININSIGFKYKVQIIVASGTTVSNLTFYPMIRKAEITDDTYEPYYMSNKELTEVVENGVVDSAEKDSNGKVINDSYVNRKSWDAVIGVGKWSRLCTLYSRGSTILTVQRYGTNQVYEYTFLISTSFKKATVVQLAGGGWHLDGCTTNLQIRIIHDTSDNSIFHIEFYDPYDYDSASTKTLNCTLSNISYTEYFNNITLYETYTEVDQSYTNSVTTQSCKEQGISSRDIFASNYYYQDGSTVPTIHTSTSTPSASDGNNGDIWIVY